MKVEKPNYKAKEDVSCTLYKTTIKAKDMYLYKNYIYCKHCSGIAVDKSVAPDVQITKY